MVRYRGDGSGGKPILLLAHMDVVTAKRADWERDPFTLIEENGFFYGRGTYDVKQGVAALTTLFLRLKAEKFIPKRDLIIFFSGDEETVAGHHRRRSARDHRELIDAEYALNADGGGGVLDDDTGKPLFFGSADRGEDLRGLHADDAQSWRPQLAAARRQRHLRTRRRAGEARPYSFPVMWNDTTLASFARRRQDSRRVALGDAMAHSPPTRTMPPRPRRHRRESALCRADPHHLRRDAAWMAATPHNALPQSAHRERQLPHLPRREDRRRPGQTLQRSWARASRVEVVGDADVERRVAVARRTWSPRSPARCSKFYPGVPVVPQQDSGATDGLVFRCGRHSRPTASTSTFIKLSDEFAHGLNERIPVKSSTTASRCGTLLVKDLSGAPKSK